MEPYLITVDSKSRGTFKHEGEEFLFVLDGAMEFNYGGKRYQVKAGDSIYFDADIEHSGKALGGSKVKMLCIIFNYRRA